LARSRLYPACRSKLSYRPRSGLLAYLTKPFMDQVARALKEE